MTDIERYGVFTESLHPRAAGKFAKKGSAAPAKKTTAAKSSAAGRTSAASGHGNLSFDGRRGAGYGKPGGDKRVHGLQSSLNRLGFSDGGGAKLKLDGKLGPKTTAAVKKAQRALGLKADGVVTPALLRKLNSAKTLKDLKAKTTKKAAAKGPKKGPGIFTKPAKAAPKKAPVTIHAGS